MLLRCLLLITLIHGVLIRAQTITVAAAVSMKEAVTLAAQNFQQKTATPVTFAFGASGQLLAQIRSGAPIDIFLSAAPQQMDELEKDGLLVDGSRRDVAGNALVLIAPPGSSLTRFDELTGDAVRHVAIGQPKTVPAGQYAQQTLESLHLFDKLQHKLVFGSNVRQVLDYIISGNAEAGLVYQTDAAEAGEKVKVIAVASEESHQPIIYSGGVLKRSSQPEAAAAFLAYLLSPDGQKVLTQHGFRPPAKP